MADGRIITRRGVGVRRFHPEVTSGDVHGANPNAAKDGPCRRGVIRVVRPTSHNSTARVDEHPQQAAIYGHEESPRAASTASPDHGAARASEDTQAAGSAIGSRSGTIVLGSTRVVGCPGSLIGVVERSTARLASFKT